MRPTLAGIAALTLALPAFAEVAVHENLLIGGYAVASARYMDSDPGGSDSTLDMDSYRLAATAKFAPVTGTISFFGFASEDPVLLDAYATYAGDGYSVTAGKFLSWLGYESFHAVNMTQITYAWQGSPGFGNIAAPSIPAYHSGVKVETAGNGYAAGFAVLDSAYGPTYYKGDGDLDNGVGLEAYYRYGTAATTLFVGAAYNSDDTADVDILTGNVWLQHVFGATTLAAEIGLSSVDIGGTDREPFFWQLFAKQNLSDQIALVGRVSGGEATSGAEFLKLTFAPLFTVTPNLQVATEYSYTDYKNNVVDAGHFLGAQVRFKF